MQNETTQFLMIEDDSGHSVLLKRAFKRCGVVDNLSHIGDGEEALRYLGGEGEYAGRPLPDVILLDLNLPKVNGLDVLRAVKEDVGLKSIPVVVLTTSSNDHDRDTAYDLGANSFLTKPVEYERFVTMIADVRHYWADVNCHSNARFNQDAA